MKFTHSLTTLKIDDYDVDDNDNLLNLAVTEKYDRKDLIMAWFITEHPIM